MATTVLFIEHLITGLQAGLWLSLFIFSYFGFDRGGVDQIKGLETPVTFIVVALLYPLGVFIDNLADDLFDGWSKKIRDKRMKSEGIEDKSMTAMKLLASTDDEFLKSYMNYIRTRIRISRSAALNFALITVASAVFTLTRFEASTGLPIWKLIVGELFIGGGIAFLATWSWYRISDTFAKQIARAYKISPGFGFVETLERRGALKEDAPKIVVEPTR